MKRKYSKTTGNAAILLIALMISLSIIVNPGLAETGNLTGDSVEPTVQFTDFQNGTTLTVLDYQNGTEDVISETIQPRTSKLQLGQNITNQALSVGLLTSTQESTDWVTATRDLMVEQEVLMGFTYRLVAYRKVVDLDFWAAYVRAGYDVDIGFGLRLPVRISLEYPKQMTVGRDYEVHARLTPLDMPEFDEFFCKFKAQVWVQAGVFNIFRWRWEEYSASWGPDYDWSRSFATPIGPAMRFPLPAFEVTVFDSARVIGFSLLKLNVVIDPQLGSNKITAKAKASGDAVGENTIAWSAPDQEKSFLVHAGNYGPTDFAKIELSDFRYYFSIFKLHFGLKFDFHSWIDWLTGDPQIELFTLDMSWLTEGLYLGVHQGTEGTIDIKLLVTRPRCFYGIIDKVDIGNPTSEAGHNMWGWGPIRYNYKDNFRVAWYSSEGTSTYARSGTLTLYRRMFSFVKSICARVFDGMSDDSFDVFVQVSWGTSWTGWRKIYHYSADASINGWVTHRISMPEEWRLANKFRVAIFATGRPWSGFAKYGQLAVDRIGLAGYIKTG